MSTAEISIAPPRPLRTLVVEDNPDDAELLLRELRRGGLEPVFRRVDTARDLETALLEQSWDVIISDYSMPSFSAPDAFAIVRKQNLDVPFIVVSGTVGEDVAVEAMRAGVHDFLLKGHLKRLVAAIERELREAAMRAERRKIQEQLLISDRMASVGTLAAGVAHEINNPLSVVIGNVQLIGQDAQSLSRELHAVPENQRKVLGDRFARMLAAANSLDESVKDADEAGERVRTIVRDLRVFSRSDEDVRAAVDLQKVLDSSIRMARNELRHRANVIRKYGEVPRVEANESRLGQVFLNLLVNAAQAIPEGRVADNSITVTTSRTAHKVMVEITDTGTGIPPEVLPRIFDVFFTTKPIGVGTGLGLAICHRIVTAMKGSIEVESQVGRGTTFRVTLLRARTGRTLETPILPEVPRTSGSAIKSVLVIEDEAAIGRALQRLLVPHDVTAVTRAREALDRIAAGQRFDVILCDLMMPELTGMDFYVQLSRTTPDLANRIVFMSGGTFTVTAAEFLSRVPNPRVDKPIDTSVIRDLIEAA